MTADTLATTAAAVDHSNSDADAGGYLTTGSPARMAALRLLGRQPCGVSSIEIRAVIRAADPRVFDDSRMKAVLNALRDAGLARTERDDYGIRWYSPGARLAEQLRRAAAASHRTTTTTTA